MGLSFRKTSGKISNGSKLVVTGQVTNGQKVFTNNFTQKRNPYELTPAQKNHILSFSGNTAN